MGIVMKVLSTVLNAAAILAFAVTITLGMIYAETYLRDRFGFEPQDLSWNSCAAIMYFVAFVIMVQICKQSEYIVRGTCLATALSFFTQSVISAHSVERKLNIIGFNDYMLGIIAFSVVISMTYFMSLGAKNTR